MKLSELTVEAAAQHVKADPDDCMLSVYLDAAKSYVLNYTGLTETEADSLPDLAVAALILTADFYDNRQATVENSNVNKVLDCILGMHRYNLL